MRAECDLTVRCSPGSCPGLYRFAKVLSEDEHNSWAGWSVTLSNSPWGQSIGAPWGQSMSTRWSRSIMRTAESGHHILQRESALLNDGLPECNLSHRMTWTGENHPDELGTAAETVSGASISYLPRRVTWAGRGLRHPPS